MANPTPFPFLDPVFDKLSAGLQPPAWVVSELHQRMVLLLNHILMQEPEAQARLARQKASVMLAQWRGFSIKLQATPAGLLDLADAGAKPDLTLTVADTSPLELLRSAMQGTKPAVTIEGDVQLAAEVNWLVDHVRWDLEEDLARIVGDGPAHAIGEVARGMASAVRKFVASVGAGKGRA